MDLRNYPSMTVQTLQQGLGQGHFTSSDILEAARSRFLETEPAIRAFTQSKPDASPSSMEGYLAGIPVAVKDLFNVEGWPVSYGSQVYEGMIGGQTASLVKRLQSHGAAIFGKTVTTEFAWRQAGPTRNPHDLRRSPGGSSSGSAAAVAAGVVPLAIGTQTFGSVIRPASFCGIIGFKPSYGLLPLAGAHPLASTLDHAGCLARSVDCIKSFFSIFAAPTQIARKTSRRVVLACGPAEKRLSPAILDMLESAASALSSEGFVVERRALDLDYDQGQAAANTILAYEAAKNFTSLVAEHGDRVSRHMHELVDAGRVIDRKDYESALAFRDGLRTAFNDLLADADAILTASTLDDAPLIETGTGDPSACTFWTLVGAPAITLPFGKGSSGLPLGIQLVGPIGQDWRVLALASQAEKALGIQVHPVTPMNPAASVQSRPS